LPSDRLQLSAEARRRIRAEEVFRKEVQRELRPEESWPIKVSALLNKPLTLWLLSSVFLGGLSWAYANWEEHRAARAETRAETRKLDIEVDGRLRRASTRLESAQNTVGLRDAIEMLDEGTGIFPELENRSLEGLLTQLTWLVPDEEKSKLENARKAYNELQQIRATGSDDAAEIIARVKRDYFNGYLGIREWAN
jgi:hypothetical protein